MARNSRIYLVKNIRMDRGYENVTNLSESSMLSLCTNSAHLVASGTNYSFIRNSENTISTAFSYSNCINANYIAFQNTDYDDKWFFAWIDEVEYRSDACTVIHYTVDSWATWYDYWPKQAAYVLREHVSSDVIGNNRQPEPISVSKEYTQYEEELIDLGSNWGIQCIATNIADAEAPTPSVQGGYFSSFVNYTLDSDQSVSSKLSYMSALIGSFEDDTEGNSIQSMNVYPTWLDGMYATSPVGHDTTYGAVKSAIHSLGRFSSSLGFSYKNAKTVQYPYVKAVFGNYDTDIDLAWEDFSNNGIASISLKGRVFPKPEIIAYPINYQGKAYNYEMAVKSMDYPECPTTMDAYAQWAAVNAEYFNYKMISNSISSSVSALSSISAGDGVGALTNVSKGVDSYLSAQNTLANKRDTPDSTIGGIPSSVVNINLTNRNAFYIKGMKLYNDELQAIDDYFTRFGYAINKIKVPNYTGRPYWNYVKIQGSVANGSVPVKYMNDINAALSKGVTIWHSHDNIGNFALDNSL